MLLFALMLSPGFSQTIGEDIVDLKSGESYIGTIIEQRPGQYLKLLQMPANDTLQFAYSEIEVLRKRIMPKEEPVRDTIVSSIRDTIIVIKEPIPSNGFNQRSVYIGLSQARGGGDWTTSGIGASILLTLPYRIQAGLSLQYYWSVNPSVISEILPVCMEGVYTVGSTKSERLSAQVRGAFGLNFVPNSLGFIEDYQTMANRRLGSYFSPAVGGRFNWSKNSGIRMELGYQRVTVNIVDSLDGIVLDRQVKSSIVFKSTIFF